MANPCDPTPSPPGSTASVPAQHRQAAPSQVACAVITVSDTRTLENDTGGALIRDLLQAAGHLVVRRELVPDGPDRLGPLLDQLKGDSAVQAVLITGGTGMAPRDLTPEVVSARLDVVLPGYGELFRMLSWDEVGAAAMLSRAIGGRMGKQVVLLMPGSRNAVRLAMEKLILPELAHLVSHVNPLTSK